VTDPEQLRRIFLQASLQRELQRAAGNQERIVIGRLGGKRGRQLVRSLPTVEVARVDLALGRRDPQHRPLLVRPGIRHSGRRGMG